MTEPNLSTGLQVGRFKAFTRRHRWSLFVILLVVFATACVIIINLDEAVPQAAVGVPITETGNYLSPDGKWVLARLFEPQRLVA